MTDKSNSKLWIVVRVHSGIPVFAEIFKEESKAWEMEKQLRKEINPEYDEVGVFCSWVR